MGMLPRLLILAAAFACVCCKTQPLPSYITHCYRNDPKLDECATKRGQAALPNLIKGDRKYRIPSLDPLEIDELVIGKGDGSISVDLKVQNLKIFGFGNTQIKSTKFDLDEKVITLNLYDPSIEVTGVCDINGRVLILPVTGKGACNITLADTDFQYILKFKLVKKADGLDYIVPTDYTMSGRPKAGYILLENLFNGNKALTNSINDVLNENWGVLIDDLGPPLLEGVGLVLKQVVSNALRDIPYDVIFPVKS